jgi:hypothetical protein
MDEPIVDTGAAASTGTDTTGAGTGTTVDTTPATAATGTAAATETSIAQLGTDGAPAADEFAGLDGLFGDLKEEEPAVADPNAAAVVPEPMAKAMSASEYIKEPAHLEIAVRAADEVWNVAAGKVPAHTMLEGIRSRDPQQFEKIVHESLIPYIEHLTGKKLGGGDAAPDPVAEMQAKIRELEQRPALEAQRRQQEQQQNHAESVSRTAVEGFIKTGSGIFDGATDDALNALAMQLPKLGIQPAAMMQEVLSGKTTLLETAYKAAEKSEMLRVKAMTQRLVARSKALRGAVPASKGAPAGSAATAVDEPPMGASREQLAEWMRTGKISTPVQ